MKKNLTLVIATLILTLSSFTAHAAVSKKSQFGTTANAEPIIFGISNGDTIDTAASKLKAFLPDLILSKKPKFYEGYIEMLSNIYNVYLFPDRETGKYVEILAIRSPEISMDDLKAYAFSFFTFRTACIFQFGKPVGEVLVLDPDGPKEEVHALEQENGLLPMDYFFTSKYDANVNCKWRDNVYLSARKKGDLLSIEYYVTYKH